MRFLLCVIIGVIVFANISYAASGKKSKRITYRVYKELSEKKKAKLLKKYVKKDNATNAWKVGLDSYEVSSTISAENAIKTAVIMDEFCMRFTEVFVGKFLIKDSPKLFVYNNNKEYAAALAKIPVAAGWSAAMFVTQRRGSKYSYSLYGSKEQGEEIMYSSMFHEGAHHLLRFYVGKTEIPVWYNEGVATNFETWNVEKSAVRNINDEIWVSTRAGALYNMIVEGKRPKLKELLALTPKKWNTSQDPHRNYAMAWGFVNSLLTEGKNGQKLFNAIMVGLRKGKSFYDILSKSNRKKLNEIWESYLDNTITPHFKYVIQLEKLAEEKKWEKLNLLLEKAFLEYPEHSVLLYYKGIYEWKKGDVKTAMKNLYALKKKYPRHPKLLKACALAAVDAKDKSKAKKYLRESNKEYPYDEEVLKAMKVMKIK